MSGELRTDFQKMQEDWGREKSFEGSTSAVAVNNLSSEVLFDGLFAGIRLLLIFVSIVVMYFLPALIASRRCHHNSAAILALNLLLGWTVFGWVLAFIWSLTAVRP